jgi:hypothetical protein
MIIAVIAVPVVQTSVDQVIRMVAMRNRLMAATFVIASARRRCAVSRVGGAHGNHAFVVVIAMGRMQVAVVQIIGMPFVLHAEVATLLAVSVCVCSVCMMRHGFCSFL